MAAHALHARSAGLHDRGQQGSHHQGFWTLRERGAVEVRERRIHVVDPEALKRAAWEY